MARAQTVEETAGTDLQAVTSLRVKNFKAIRDSGELKLTPLTVFVGNNGVGKSSVIEALEAIHTMAWVGLDAAIDERWRGFDYIRNRSTLTGGPEGAAALVVAVAFLPDSGAAGSLCWR